MYLIGIPKCEGTIVGAGSPWPTTLTPESKQCVPIA